MRSSMTALVAIGAAVAFASSASAQFACGGNGCKVCSAINPPNWRDTIVMPGTALSEECRKFAVAIAAPQWQLACMLANGHIRWANSQSNLDTGPDIPFPNCGW